MMKEYISRQAVLKMIDDAEPMNRADSESEIQAHIDYDFFRELVKAQPTADVVEVKHGEWEQGDYYDIGDVCSVCGYSSTFEPCEYNYCPNCGADMRGIRDER